MKRLIIVTIVCITAIFTNHQASGQSLDGLPFKERLWYGGGFVVGFSGGNGISIFQLGLSPMVGYKFSERFSAGPRVSALVNFTWAETFSGNRSSAQPVNWGIGVFSRYKITPVIFAHVEYEYADQALILQGFDELILNRFTNDNIYIGGGYSSGVGASQFEVVALYNINQSIQSFDSPFTFRFGFTQNF